MSIFNKVTKTFQWGYHTVILETGEIARQAGGAVLVDIEGTVVLATVVASKSAKPGQDFFPLTVDYIEKTYAAGKIPGSFFKREAKPSEHETLTSRLIDRPIRPLFPEGFFNEVHVVIHTLSLNPEVDADIAAMIGVSAALSISGIPFAGPIGAARVGYVNGEYVLNPGQTARKMSRPGPDRRRHRSRRADGGIRSPAAVRRNHAGRRGVRPRAGQHRHQRHPRTGARSRQAGVGLAGAGQGRGLHRQGQRPGRREAARRLPDPQQAGPHPGPARSRRRRAGRPEGRRRASSTPVKVDDLLFDIEAKIVRSQILSGEPRIDGRDTRTVRPIEIRTGVLPRTHGSALFTRGETQALVVTTLGTERDAQRIDALMGEYEDRFMFHYNMPPFATGEVGRMGSHQAPRNRPRPPGQARADRRCCRPRKSSPTRCAWSPKSPNPTAPRRWLRSAAAACR